MVVYENSLLIFACGIIGSFKFMSGGSKKLIGFCWGH